MANCSGSLICAPQYIYTHRHIFEQGETLMLQKSRMPQFQGIRSDAVTIYIYLVIIRKYLFSPLISAFAL